MSEQAEVAQVKEATKHDILAKPNVVGVGIGYKETGGRVTDQLSVVALVRDKVPKAALDPREMVPREVNGVPTDVVEVGELRAQQSRRERWRPAPGGVSLGHFRVTAGTLGAVVRDRATGDRLILSNNHVLANTNDAAENDPILQPGAADGGRAETDIVARLERFCPIDFSIQPGTCELANAYAVAGNLLARALGSSHRVTVYQAHPQAVNLVDAAVARPVNDGDILDEILEIGVVMGAAPAVLGMSVRKSGRTTGLTTGTITVLHATVDVSYRGGRTARFEDQIVTSPMSQGGDSGSLLVRGDALLAVGLLFAGSDQSTIHSPIEAVLDCLEVTL